MRIHELMTPAPRSCRPGDSLDRAARDMWEHDIGSLPVVNEAGVVVGMITDRDICMAAFLGGRAPHELTVAQAMARHVVTCRPDDAGGAVRQLMADHQVRRIPVVDGEGRLRGVLSLADLALEAQRARGAATAEIRPADVAQLLAAVCAPRKPRRARAA